ncbi:hypothetical protein UA08_00354 [Talaromyces atroroseus]|uniref:Uncharacterized protein n=1 Tax=Talaromyces atroroseus TaxID=1441469 RepID=A0A225B7B5_TALAT|nr:hypothetical protein UA08_00354 [Talaromyces atroroseus]OKL64009.1 hypothetical protein UA08_00354 [Talaromyces atroroseus]
MGCLRKISAETILSHLLSRTNVLHQKRYGPFFEEYGMDRIEKMVFDAFTPGMQTILDLDSIGLEELMEISGDPAIDKDAGIYLHIITTTQSSLDQVFWLYVGQSFELRECIGDHNDPEYHRKHPSLHYKVGDSIDDVKSNFVKIATVQGKQHRSMAYLLNIIEMFACCIFQTLRPNDLEKYLPTNVPKPWADQHLNLALPLWQGFSDQAMDETVVTRSFTECLFSTDPLVRQWAEHLRDVFHSLSSSPDPKKREYWRQLIMENFVQTGHNALMQKTEKKYGNYLRHGKECTIRINKQGHPTLCRGKYKLQVQSFNNLGFRLAQGQTVLVRPILMDNPSPLRYVWKASPGDPCSRLLFFVKATAHDQKEHSFFLSSGSKQAISYMNTFVDILEGLPLELSLQQPGRTSWKQVKGNSVYFENNQKLHGTD